MVIRKPNCHEPGELAASNANRSWPDETWDFFKPRLDLMSEKLAVYDVMLLNDKGTSREAKANPDSVWTDTNTKAFAAAVRAGRS